MEIGRTPKTKIRFLELLPPNPNALFGKDLSDYFRKFKKAISPDNKPEFHFAVLTS
jgi:hypothetical protein